MSSEYAELSCALCGEDNHTTLYHAKMLETERDTLRSQNAELMNMLTWHVNHEGECLGDHPELLEAARALLARVKP